MENNRRKFSRIPVGGETCQVSINGHSYHAKLVDQSIGGFRIEGLNLLMLPDNVPIVLEFDGESTEVVCRNVARVGDNSFAVGLQRTDLKKPKKDDEESTEITPQIFINSYVRLDETFKTLCWPLAVNESKLVVEVAGGKEFQVGLGKIQTFTQIERLRDLRKSDSLKRLAELYTVTTGKIIRPIPETIAEFEFGPDNRLCVTK